VTTFHQPFNPDKMSTCQLCKNEKILLKKSHIIPDFYYRECKLYNDNHQLKLMKATTPTQKFEQIKNLNSGIYDKNILCSSCDNELLGQLESYLRPFFFGGTIGTVGNPDFKHYIGTNKRKFIQLTNISYTKAKLGLLSILWRASISKNDFFASVKLDSEIEEELRFMLLNKEPKEIHKFPIVCLSILGQHESFLQVIAAPRKLNDKHGSGFIFLLGGIFILFYISHKFTDVELERNSLSPKNKMTIVEIDDGDGLGWILSYFGLKSKKK
jgi:hypothetical protein